MAETPLKVLVIGSGGREHAILKACLASPLVASVAAAPGNGGMAAEAECHAVDVEDPQDIVRVARETAASFVIVGPEVPLCAGAVDALAEAGIEAYGPNSAGAKLEASKAFTKAFLEKHRIPTATSATFTDSQLDAALEYLESQSYPLVVKASGLAAGKGVIIARGEEQAKEAARAMLSGDLFGESGREVVIEEFLDGEEASIMLMVSGENYIALPPSQDHKRIGEGDTGMNTGGMGAYAPAAVITPEIQEKLRANIIVPTLAGLKADGIDFRGTLFIGIMVVNGEPKVLEFNVRFGDPECQILLPLLKNDPVQLMLDCARGTLDPSKVETRDGYTMIVVLAAEGYPGSYPKGEAIQLPDTLPESISIVHAGTKRDADGTIRSAGGRVLGVVAHADSLKAAADLAYAAADQVQWKSKYLRRDIGWRQLERES